LRPTAVILVSNKKNQYSFLQLLEQYGQLDHAVTKVLVYADLGSLSDLNRYEANSIVVYNLFLPFDDYKQLI